MLLGVGTFAIGASNLTLYAQSGVSLRGSGPQSTTVTLTSGLISFGISWNPGSCTWASGFAAGSTSLTMSGCTGPALVPGEMIYLTQCDSGFSGTGCATGSTSDNGAVYVCGDNNSCQIDTDTGLQQHQYETVYASSVSGSGTITVNFKPALKLTNWASGQTPLVTWETSSSAGNTANPYGNGLENMTVSVSGHSNNNSVSVDHCYACWVKGVRFVGSGSAGAVVLSFSTNSLLANNYMYPAISLDSALLASIQVNNTSNSLVLNNISTSGFTMEGLGSNSNNVFSYNYGRDSFTIFAGNYMNDHHAWSGFDLFEGNQTGTLFDDNTWGTHDLQTWMRNYLPGGDLPYSLTPVRSLQFDAYHRFENAVANSLGDATISQNYQSVPASVTTAPVYLIDINGNSDPLVLSTLMRWGNCDTVTATCRFQSSEVPTTLSGNAIPFQNSVPASHNVPCSFFMSAFSSAPCSVHSSGGTGLSWWKVCTSWSSFPASCSGTQTQTFPIAGPDITGGPYVNGTAYDIPAAIAFKNLPIDTSLQNSYSITGSSWSGGIETLTISGLPDPTHLMGPFQVSSGACSTGSGEAYMTGSSSTTVSYALVSNPGSCSGASMKFPDVRQFDEAIYQSDPSGGGGAAGSALSGSSKLSGSGIIH